MRISVKFRLFNIANGNLIPEKRDSFETIDIETSYKSDIDHLVKVELAETLGKPLNHIKVLSYTEI